MYGLVESTTAKVLFLGVVSLGCFAPDWCLSSVAMLHDRHDQLTLKQLRLSVLNEMHRNSYTGPRLSRAVRSCHCPMIQSRSKLCDCKLFMGYRRTDNY